LGKYSYLSEYDLRSQLALNREEHTLMNYFGLSPMKIFSMRGYGSIGSRAIALLVMVVALLGGATLMPNLAHAAKKTVHFYNDIAGTPQMAVDAVSGQVLWKETYRPYGERINNSPASATGKGQNELYFHGKQAETLNNGVTIQYFGARYTMPGLTDRFTSVDPVHFQESSVHSFNRYAYGNNNPYRFVDPDGNAPVWAPMMIYFGGGAAAGAGGGAGINIAAQMFIHGRSFGDVQWRGVGGVFESASEGAMLGMFLGPALGAEAGAARAAVNSPAMKTVGRHMSADELSAMRQTGRVQEGGGGQTRVADPASRDTYKNAPKGDIYVEFSVPASRVLPHSDGTGRIAGPNSPDARVPGRNAKDFEMPPATNITVP
jgi:RHS repeat-associated protein